MNKNSSSTTTDLSTELSGSFTKKYGDDTESDEDQFLIVDEPVVVPALPPQTPSSQSKKRKPLLPHELLPDEECVKIVAESIKKIIRQSNNEVFRQECFRLMNIKNSDGVEPVLRKKLRSTIGLDEPVSESSNSAKSQSQPVETINLRNAGLSQPVTDCSNSPSQPLLTTPMLREKLRITPEYSQTGLDNSCSSSQPIIVDPVLREKFRLGVTTGYTQISSDLSSSQSLLLSQQLVSVSPSNRNKDEFLRKLEARRPSRQSKGYNAVENLDTTLTSTQ